MASGSSKKLNLHLTTFIPETKIAAVDSELE